jgi:hypothetical protein
MMLKTRKESVQVAGVIPQDKIKEPKLSIIAHGSTGLPSINNFVNA